jgi:ubiquinone biosynthesis protein
MPELLTVPWPAWVLGTLGLAFLLGAVWKRSELEVH